MKKSLLVMILAFLILLSTASTAQAVEIVKSVPFVGQSPMVYDPYKGAIWVIPKYLIEYRLGVPIYAPTNSVLAISDSDNAVLANVTVGQHPISLAYDSALHEVYVTTGNNVSVISDVSNSVVATIDSNTNFSRGGFYGIVYDSGKGEMFVSSVNGGVSVILVISCSIKQVVASIPITNNPSSLGLTYDSAKGEIYVSYNSFSELNSPCFISVISDSTNSVIATIPLDKGITFLELKPGAYDSATGEIYLPTSNNSVLVVSDKTHTVVDSILLDPQFANSVGTVNVAYDPVKSVIFASEFSRTYIISDRTRSVIETLPIHSFSMVYDSGKNVMLCMDDGFIRFVSDASLPSPPPTPTPTSSASPSPSGNQNPVFLGLDWVQLAILVLMGIVVVVVGVAAFMFLSRRRGTEQTKPA